MNRQQKQSLIHIMEMHDETTENFGNPFADAQGEVSQEEWEAFVALHGIKVDEITEEEFEEQKAA